MLNTVDFRNVSDTGEPEAPAIQPIADGEPAGQVAFRRPVENTRVRTDVLRQVMREHVVLQDVQAQLLSGGGTITFDGARTSYSGKAHLGADLTVLPFATPGGSGTAPYVQSTYATRRLIGADVVNDILLFTSRYRQWQRPSGGAAPDWAAEADQISIEIVHTGTLSVTVGGAASKQTNIYITINYGVTTCQQVIDAVAANTDANKLVIVTYDGGSTSAAPSPRFTTTEWSGDYSARFLRGGAPGLAHVITDDVLNNVTAGFFNLHVENPLKKGDTLAIWYDALVNLAATGGRLQSTPENLNIAIPATALFNSRREPEKIPNCIPLCKCIDDNTLVFIDGSRIIRGTPASLWWDSQHILSGSSSPIDYSTWTRVRYAPGAHVPPTNVQMAFDNVDDIFEAILNGSQAFVAATGNNGITATGAGTHDGVNGTGGTTSGTGVSGFGGGPDGSGVAGHGTGAGYGVWAQGGATGSGVVGSAGASGNGTGVGGQGAGSGAGIAGTGGATGPGVTGVGGGTAGKGVTGTGTGNQAGVYGTGGPTDGVGVIGDGRGNGSGGRFTGAGAGIGVYGEGGSSGVGVYGLGHSANGVEGHGTVGVYGHSAGDCGVKGVSAGGGDYGVIGESSTNSGVKGIGGGSTGAGVSGDGHNPGPYTSEAPGVRGHGGAGKCGVEGTGGTNESGSAGEGVFGQGANDNEGGDGAGVGVHGIGGDDVGGGGAQAGVLGEGGSPGGVGVIGYGNGAGTGVMGEATTGYGTYGHASSGYGVYGTTSSGPAGVYGQAAGAHYGVEGANPSGVGVGVYGHSASGTGVRAEGGVQDIVAGMWTPNLIIKSGNPAMTNGYTNTITNMNTCKGWATIKCGYDGTDVYVYLTSGFNVNSVDHAYNVKGVMIFWENDMSTTNYLVLTGLQCTNYRVLTTSDHLTDSTSVFLWSSGTLVDLWNLSPAQDLWISVAIFAAQT
jgi:hypothetical protein